MKAKSTSDGLSPSMALCGVASQLGGGKSYFAQQVAQQALVQATPAKVDSSSKKTCVPYYRKFDQRRPG